MELYADPAFRFDAIDSLVLGAPILRQCVLLQSPRQDAELAAKLVRVLEADGDGDLVGGASGVKKVVLGALQASARTPAS